MRFQSAQRCRGCESTVLEYEDMTQARGVNLRELACSDETMRREQIARRHERIPQAGVDL